MFYEAGAIEALQTLGFAKNASAASKLMRAGTWPFRKMGPKAGGGFLGTGPFTAPAGALAGGVTGAIAGEEGDRVQSALLGAVLGGGIGGLASGTHGAVRHHLSKVPRSLPVGRGSTTHNPAAEEVRKRIFREAAGVSGAAGVGGGLLAAGDSDKTGGARDTLLKALKSKEYGEFMTRMPIQATTGGALGAATGSLSDHPLQGAGIGALGGLLSGFSVAAAPRLRGHLIKKFQGVA